MTSKKSELDSVSARTGQTVKFARKVNCSNLVTICDYTCTCTHTFYQTLAVSARCKGTASYLAVFSNGCLVPTSFLTCMATLLSSSLRRQRRLMKEVGYPTIFSASDTTLVQLEGPELEKRLSVLRPRLHRARQDMRDQVNTDISPSDFSEGLLCR